MTRRSWCQSFTLCKVQATRLGGSMYQLATHRVLWHGNPEESLLSSHKSTYTSLIKDLRCHLPNNRYVSDYSLTELEFHLGFILVWEVNSHISQTVDSCGWHVVVSFKCIQTSFVAWRNLLEHRTIKLNKEAWLTLVKYFLSLIYQILLYQV